jgi:hypothetical protein
MPDMGRARLAIVLLLVSSACAAALLPTSSGAASGRAWTHRITVVTGELVDHWTFNDPSPCGDFGDGTVTLKFHMTATPRVRLVLDPTHNGEPNNTLGSWVVGIPGPTGGLRDARPWPAAGTVTLVDSTTQHPPPPGVSDCTPKDKSGCGTTALGSAAKSSIAGYNRHFLVADVYAVSFEPRRGHDCRIGQTVLFTEGRISGGTPRGELLLPMPSVSTVAHRRVLTVIGTSHKVTSTPDCGSGTTCSDDISRRVGVTFKHV